MMLWVGLPLLLMAATAAETPQGLPGQRQADPAESSVSTAATPLFLNRCEARGEAAWRCAGLPGTDVFISEAGGNFRVSLGSEETGGETFHIAHTLGKTMEWRIAGNQPQSGIVRYRFAASEAGPAQDLLAIFKVATRLANGCLVAVVDVGANSGGQEFARLAADETVPGFQCGRDKPAAYGRVSARARDELLPSLY